MERILVLAGGISNEREVSLKSAENVTKSLQAAGYEVIMADPASSDFNLSNVVSDIDAVIPMLHGVGGEDGDLQRELEQLNVPYFGSDSISATLSFDKAASKKVFEDNNVLTPRYQVVDRQQFEASELRHLPYVLKPIKGGSSIDTFIVHDPDHDPIQERVVDDVFSRYTAMLIEELIEGEEITVGVLDDTPLPIILIIPPKGQEFDYENKYNGQTQEITQPESISKDVEAESQEIALKVHQLLGARHISRTDMIVTDKGDIYTLELNAIPGMTRESLIPKAAAAAGIDIASLVTKFVKMAQRDYHKEKE